MLTKLFAGVVVAVGLGVSALAGVSAIRSSNCCAVGADCCYPGSPCCESGTCCAPGANCCDGGGPCCSPAAATPVKADKPNCCAGGACSAK